MVDKFAIQLVGSSEFTISHPLAVPKSHRNRFMVGADWIVVENRKHVGIVDPNVLVSKPRKPGSQVSSWPVLVFCCTEIRIFKSGLWPGSPKTHFCTQKGKKKKEVFHSSFSLKRFQIPSLTHWLLKIFPIKPLSIIREIFQYTHKSWNLTNAI